MFIISCQGRYFSAIIYGNGYVFMEILQSLIIFDAPFTVKLFPTITKNVFYMIIKKNGMKKFHWKRGIENNQRFDENTDDK